MPDIATYDVTNLPVQFKYIPYVPKKRRTKTATATAVITQSADPVTVDGEGLVSFTVDALPGDDYQTILSLYLADALVEFIGYWGERLLIRFESLVVNGVSGRIFSISGDFQVVCVLDPYNAQC